MTAAVNNNNMTECSCSQSFLLTLKSSLLSWRRKEYLDFPAYFPKKECQHHKLNLGYKEVRNMSYIDEQWQTAMFFQTVLPFILATCTYLSQMQNSQSPAGVCGYRDRPVVPHRSPSPLEWLLIEPHRL